MGWHHACQYRIVSTILVLERRRPNPGKCNPTGVVMSFATSTGKLMRWLVGIPTRMLSMIRWTAICRFSNIIGLILTAAALQLVVVADRSYMVRTTSLKTARLNGYE